MTSHVYVMTDGAEFKIGKANVPAERLAQLRTARPLLRLLVSVPLADSKTAFAHERGLQAAFVDLRLRREWYRPDPAIDSLVDRLRELENEKRELTFAIRRAGASVSISPRFRPDWATNASMFADAPQICCESLGDDWPMCIRWPLPGRTAIRRGHINLNHCDQVNRRGY